MKKVLLVTLEYPPQIGGVGRYYHQLVQHAPAGSFKVLDNHKSQLLKPWWKAFWPIWQELRRLQPDSIIIGQVLPLGTVIAALTFFTRHSFIVFTHGMDVTTPQAYRRKRWLLRWIFRRSSAIAAVSRYTATQVKVMLPPQLHEKIVVLPPGPVITPAIPTGPTPPLPKQFILSVGRLIPRKGFDQVIRALAQLPTSCAQYHYCIAGNGPAQTDLKALAQACGVSDRVHILNDFTDQQIATLYQRCAFLVMPARRLADGDLEGFGIVVLEANSFAKPAIGGVDSGMADAISDGNTGILVDGTDVTAVRQAMQDWMLQPQMVTAFGQRAQTWVKTQQRWSDNVARLLELTDR